MGAGILPERVKEMFKNIKTFELEDLKGRNLDIRSFTDDMDKNVALILASDTTSGEVFVLAQIVRPVANQCP